MSDPIIPVILREKYVGRQYTMVENDYTTLKMLDGGPTPPKAEIEAFWPEVEQSLKTRKYKAPVNADAKRRIIALFPGATLENYRDKELTEMMRGARLAKKKEAGTISAAELSEYESLDAKAAKIEAIISASNLILSDITASPDPDNFDVVNSPRWPL